jgi:hypothetical protein
MDFPRIHLNSHGMALTKGTTILCIVHYRFIHKTTLKWQNFPKVSKWTFKNIETHSISNLWSLITPSKQIYFECSTTWTCRIFWKISTYHTLQSKENASTRSIYIFDAICLVMCVLYDSLCMFNPYFLGFNGWKSNFQFDYQPLFWSQLVFQYSKLIMQVHFH